MKLTIHHASRQSARVKALQSALTKQSSRTRKTAQQDDAAIRNRVDTAITIEGRMPAVFTATGLPKLNINTPINQFLAEVKPENVAADPHDS